MAFFVTSQVRPGAPMAWYRNSAMIEAVGVLDAHLLKDLTNIVLHYMPQGPQGRLVRCLTSGHDVEFEHPRGVAVCEQQGLVLVADSENHRICVHRLSDGAYVRFFGYSRERIPLGVSVSESADLAFVTELSTDWVSVWKISDGSFVRQWQAWFPFLKARLGGVAVSSLSDSQFIYCADHQHNCIRVFGFDGSLVRSFGTRGSGAGQLISPFGICVYGGLIYVTERGNHRISVFNESDNLFVRHIGSAVEFRSPQGIAVSQGWLAVSDLHRVSVFSTNNTDDGDDDCPLIDQWGSSELLYPQLLCWSRVAGVLLVADTNHNRVLWYD